MDTLIELKDFYKHIIEYEDLIKTWGKKLSKINENDLEQSRTILQRWYPKLEKKISHYGEYHPPGERIGRKIDVFEIAFGSVDESNYKIKFKVLNEVKEILNRAIGRLEAQGETWGIVTSPRPERKSTKKRNVKKTLRKKIYKEVKDIGATIIAKVIDEKTK